MDYSCQSETGTLKSVFIKRAADAFMDNNHINQYWQPLNFLQKPDMKFADHEYAGFESILRSHGVEIHHFPQSAMVNMDSIYCRDASICTDHGMILCNMGKVHRNQEPAAQRKTFESNQIPILGEIRSPGTLEGGDTAWLHENILAVGHSYRTNQEGIRQLKELLIPAGIEVIIVDLPHYKGPSDVFHLMSILSPVDKDLAVVYSPLMPVRFRNFLKARAYKFIEVEEKEFNSMGCNVLALGPRNCLMVAGNSATRAALEDAGCRVTEYQGKEISWKGGGGPTCLTRPILRHRD